MKDLLNISGGDNSKRAADVIFIHGLEGDAKTTWHPKNQPESFWPVWLGEACPRVGFWSLSYAVSASAWKGHGMPLYDRANWMLNIFEQNSIGQRPLGFVCHSLGGLLCKQALRNGKDSNNPAWEDIVKQTRFIVFLSTPHSGANLASWMQYMGTLLRATVNVQELEAHDSQLRDLNSWYRNQVADLGIKNFVYCEERKTGAGPLGMGGIVVVDKTTADPGIPRVIPIVLDEDHISICKPVSKDAPVYRQVQQMIEELLTTIEPVTPMMKETPANSEPRPEGVRYSGQAKIAVCDRLHDSWPELADHLEIPVADRYRFERGWESQGVWEWLESRRDMAKLEPALQEIGRKDLVEELRRDPR